MGKLTNDAGVILDHLAYIRGEERRTAYMALLVGMTGLGYTPVPRTYDAGKRDVHFQASDGRPFSIIANRSGLRFYVRTFALRKKPDLMATAPRGFAESKSMAFDEHTTIVQDGGEAEAIVDWIRSLDLT